MSKKAPQFTAADVGQHVVFKGFDGGSYSATITAYDNRLNDAWVRIQYYPTGPQAVYATIVKADWHRLTKFPQQSKFFVLGV